MDTALHLACRNKHMVAVKRLLEGDGIQAINICNFEHETALSIAIKTKDAKLVKLLLQKGANPNATGYKQKTPLSLAFAQKDMEMIKLLLDSGADPNDMRDGEPTLLTKLLKERMDAARRRPLILLLLAKGADVNIVDFQGASAFYTAIVNNYREIVLIFIQKGGHLKDLPKAKLRHVLDWANRHGYTDIARLVCAKLNNDKYPSNIKCHFAKKLLQNEHYPMPIQEEDNVVESEGETTETTKTTETTFSALNADVLGQIAFYALFDENPNPQKTYKQLSLTCKTFRDVSANPASLFHVSHQTVIRGLPREDATAKVYDSRRKEHQKYPLIMAVRAGSKSHVEALLAMGADVNAHDKWHGTALIWAAHNKKESTDIAKLLIEHGANVNARSENGGTALTVAASKGHENMVTLLIKHGGKLTCATNNGSTVLHHLINGLYNHLKQPLDSSEAYARYARTAKILIENHAPINTQTVHGDTALMAAASVGAVDIAEMLIEKGALVNLANKEGRTALFLACENGHTSILKLLFREGIKNKVNMNATDTKGNSPLVCAAQNGHKATVEMLFNNGIGLDNVSLTNALIGAIRNSHIDIVTLLIEHGAVLNARNTSGTTPLTYAVQSGNIPLVKLLLTLGADANEVNNDGTTPLMHAAQHSFSHNNAVDKNAALVAVLLKAKANVHARSHAGETALVSAMTSHTGIRDVHHLLIGHGAHLGDLSQSALYNVTRWMRGRGYDDIGLYTRLKIENHNAYISEDDLDAHINATLGYFFFGLFIALTIWNPAFVPITAVIILLTLLSVAFLLILGSHLACTTKGMQQRMSDKRSVKKSDCPILKKLIENEKSATLKEKAAHKVGCAEKSESETVAIAETVITTETEKTIVAETERDTVTIAETLLTSETVTLDTSTANDTANTTEKNTELRPEQNLETTLGFPHAWASMRHR